MVCVGPSGDESGGTLSTAAGGSEDLLFGTWYRLTIHCLSVKLLNPTFYLMIHDNLTHYD